MSKKSDWKLQSETAIIKILELIMDWQATDGVDRATDERTLARIIRTGEKYFARRDVAAKLVKRKRRT